MTLFDFFIIVLSSGAVIDVWFNGSIFGEWRAFLQAETEDLVLPDDLVLPEPESPDSSDLDEIDDGDPLPFMMRVADRLLPDWLVDLLLCSFCLSYHPWVLILLFFCPMLFDFESEKWTFLFKLPLYSLAVTRMGNIINSILPNGAKYDRDF